MKSVDHATMLMSMLVSDMAIATASLRGHRHKKKRTGR